MDLATLVLITALLVGFYMAWNIGANDVANAMGTSVGSGALNLRRAVIVAATLEFGGAFLAGSDVSETVMKGIVHTDVFKDNPLTLAYGMLGALMAAGVWLQLASYFGWPVSTTHSIIGAIVGFGAVHGGMDAVQWDQVGYIVGSWLISPLMGGTIAYLFFMYLRRTIFYNAHPLEQVKRITPFIVFVVMSTLGAFMIFKGLKSLSLGIPDSYKIVIIFAVALIASMLSTLLVRRLQATPEAATATGRQNPQVLVGLDKAAKHLRRAKDAAEDEQRFQIGVMLDEVQTLRQAVRKGVEVQADSSEYRYVERVFAYMQVLTASMMAFAHGANDVANAIGPIAAVVMVVQTGHVALASTVPVWILGVGGVGIVLGLATWGWRVIDTVGKKITELTPSRGFAAEFGAATTILLASRLGLPISTTHTLIGAILGVGLARGIGAINVSIVREIVASWVVTVPAGAGLSILFFNLFKTLLH